MTQTVAAFYTALNSLNVTGVTRRYAYEPNGISTADMPAQWVRLPGNGLGIDSAFASASNDTSKERSAELVIAVEAIGQETPGAATTALVAMADNLETALDGWDATRPGYVNYTIAAGPVTVGQVAYWALIANVTTRG